MKKKKYKTEHKSPSYAPSSVAELLRRTGKATEGRQDTLLRRQASPFAKASEDRSEGQANHPPSPTGFGRAGKIDAYFVFIFFILLFYPLSFIPHPSCYAQVLTGLDILQKQDFEQLKGKRVGIITNHTSLDWNGRNAVDVLYNSGKVHPVKSPVTGEGVPTLRRSNFTGVNLVAIFSPEHGFRGLEEGGKIIVHSTDSETGLPIYSLYGKNKKPAEEMLKAIDVLLFDIQDIGARFYTYLTTMGYAMEEAAKAGIEFMVLDRPNPINGNVIEGPVLQDDIRHFTAYFPVPVRHGFTPGEMALFHRDNLKLNLNLSVVKMQGWKRDMWFDQTQIVWTAPSPNIRSMNAEILYPGIGCFEATNVSVGRGTGSPFLWFGSPWMKAKKIVKKLSKSEISGARFHYEERTPSTDVYAGEKCPGIKIEITDRENIRPLDIFVHAVYFLNKYNASDFKVKPEEIRKMTGTDDLYRMLNAGAKPGKILEKFKENGKIFEEKRKKYLLYN